MGKASIDCVQTKYEPKGRVIRRGLASGDIKSPFGYCWKLKTENCKYCNKIVFKYVNSVVGPIFNEIFIEKRGL